MVEGARRIAGLGGRARGGRGREPSGPIPDGGRPGRYRRAMFRPRLCARPGCGDPASAMLTFQYATGTVWLLDLSDPDPCAIDLCSRHAERTTPPLGWTVHDRRAAAVSTPVAS